MVIINLARRLPRIGDLSLSPNSACKLLLQQIRHKGNRPNLKNPLPPHYNRARLMAVCEPVYPPEPKNCFKDAMKTKKAEIPVEDNPYAVFLAGQMRRDLTNHPLTVMFHCNSYTQHELINIKGALYDMKYEMKIREMINSNVAKMALIGTKWSPLLKLIRSRTAMGFCTSDSIPDLQKAVKKMPQFVLMAVLVHGRILHKDAMEELGRLRDITNVRAQFSSTLALQSVTLSQNLTANINALSHSLTTYSKPPEDDEDTSSSSSSSDDSDSDSDSSSSSDSEPDKKK